MRRRNEWPMYAIPFLSMKPGRHAFHFEADAAFFAERPESLIKDAHLDVEIVFDKRDDHHFELHFTVRGTYRVTCDRCLDEFDLPVEGTFRLTVERTDRGESDDDDLLYLPLHEHEVPIGEHIYQYAHMMLPFRKVCAMGNRRCDPEMEKLIASYSPGRHLSQEEKT